MFNPRGGGGGKRELELSCREIEWFYLLFLSSKIGIRDKSSLQEERD